MIHRSPIPVPGRPKLPSWRVWLHSAQHRRRIRRWLLLAVLGGAVAGIVISLPNTRNAQDTPISKQPAWTAPVETSVPADPISKVIARRFIETAVLRRDLDWAYDHAHVDLKGRMTRAEWDSGAIPVIPYPAANASSTAFVLHYSFKTEVLYEVELVAKPGTGIRPMLFYIGLKRKGDRPTGRWLVNYWEPHYRPPVPYAG